jgi:hypothetical protein
MKQKSTLPVKSTFQKIEDQLKRTNNNDLVKLLDAVCWRVRNEIACRETLEVVSKRTSMWPFLNQLHHMIRDSTVPVLEPER